MKGSSVAATVSAAVAAFPAVCFLLLALMWERQKERQQAREEPPSLSPYRLQIPSCHQRDRGRLQVLALRMGVSPRKETLDVPLCPLGAALSPATTSTAVGRLPGLGHSRRLVDAQPPQIRTETARSYRERHKGPTGKASVSSLLYLSSLWIVLLPLLLPLWPLTVQTGPSDGKRYSII